MSGSRDSASIRIGEPLVRDAVPGDAEAVAALWTEAYVTLGVGGRTHPYSASDFTLARRGGELFVVDGAAGLAGVAGLRGPDARRIVAVAGEAELSRLAVAASERRRGIGRALVEHCERRARAAGWEAIALWSRPEQRAAHRLYESLGYRRAPERDSRDAGGHRHVFRLALGEAGE